MADDHGDEHPASDPPSLLRTARERDSEPTRPPGSPAPPPPPPSSDPTAVRPPLGGGPSGPPPSWAPPPPPAQPLADPPPLGHAGGGPATLPPTPEAPTLAPAPPAHPAPATVAAPPVAPPDVVLTPRKGAKWVLRRAPAVTLGFAVVLTAVAVWNPTWFTIGLAATTWVFALGTWAARALGPPARLSVTRGLLQVRTDAGRFVFDLTSPASVIEVVGQPDERGWQVRFGRRHLAPFVVDSSMVEPQEFLQVLRHYRPSGVSGVSTQ